MKNTKPSILVVEDDKAILEGLMDVLVFNGYEPTGEENGLKGMEKSLEGNFDLLILDVMLPGMDGFSICREVRRKKPNQPVIMLTAKGAEEDIVTGFKSGADDYISKPFSIRELMVRIEAVLRRSGRAPEDERIEYRGISFCRKTLTAGCGSLSTEITRREMDIVSYLYNHRDRIVSKKELLKEVWQYSDTSIETRTVDIHILKLRKKIVSFFEHTGSFITTIRGEGYRLEPEE